MRALFYSCAVLAAPLALAADDGPKLGDATAANYLDTVLVAGSRTPTTIGRVGASATVIDRSDFDLRQSAFAVDLLRDVPGVTFSNAGGFGKQTQLRLRGAEANHVKVMIDGIDANDLGGNDEFEFGNLTTADIERIEIVRGPQSSLWGSDALAGVVNIITRTDDGPLHAEAGYQGGSFGTNLENVSLGGHAGNARMRLGVSRISTRGTNVARQGDEEDGYHAVTANLSGAWQPIDALQFSMTARTTAANNQYDSGFPLPTDTAAVAKTDQSYIGTHGKLALADGHWLQQIDLTWSKTGNDNVDPSAAFLNSVDGERYKANYQNTLRFALAGPMPSRHSVTIAVDHQHATFDQSGPAAPGFDPNQHQHMNMTGLVGEYRIELPYEVSLSGSIRHDFDSQFDDVTTYRGALTWLLTPTATTFNLAYGTGQKAPTFIDRFGYFKFDAQANPFVGNPKLKPSQSHGWEIGFSQPLLAERLRLNVTWFSERLEDEILGYTQIGNLLFSAVNLPGTSIRDGLEFALNARLPAGFSASTSYTYLDAIARDVTSHLLKDEVRRPHHQLGANLGWASPSQRIHADLHMHYTGEQHDLFFGTFPAQAVALENFTVVGMSASYDVTRSLQVYARLDNVFDEHYEEVLGYQAPGVAGFMGLRLSYDRL